MKAIKTSILCFLSLSYSACLVAQTQVEVITKSVEKKILYKSGYHISLQGQGAKIIVGTSMSKDIQVNLKLISKGLTREVAEKELNYQKYVIDELNRTVVIRNYLLLPNNVELSTIQEIIMEVLVPGGVNLSISNSFGSIEIADFSAKIDIESEYGDIFLDDFKGECTIKGNYGDFKGSNLSGRLLVDTDHIEIELSSFTGTSKINSNLGNVFIKDLYQIEDFEIKGEKSDISIQMKNPDVYRWAIKSRYGSIQVPDIIKLADTDNNKNRLLSGSENLPEIELSTDFGDITIEEK